MSKIILSLIVATLTLISLPSTATAGFNGSYASPSQLTLANNAAYLRNLNNSNAYNPYASSYYGSGAPSNYAYQSAYPAMASCGCFNRNANYGYQNYENQSGYRSYTNPSYSGYYGNGIQWNANYGYNYMNRNLLDAVVFDRLARQQPVFDYTTTTKTVTRNQNNYNNQSYNNSFNNLNYKSDWMNQQVGGNWTDNSLNNVDAGASWTDQSVNSKNWNSNNAGATWSDDAPSYGGATWTESSNSRNPGATWNDSNIGATWSDQF